MTNQYQTWPQYIHKVSDELVMGQIEPEHLELFAFEFGKIAEYDFVYTLIIYKYWPISTKLGQNVCDHKIWD